MFKEFPVTVDLKMIIRSNSFLVNTNDLDSLKLSITIRDNGKPVDISDAKIRIAIQKPDRKAVLQDCEITNGSEGKCTVVLTNQAYLLPGEHKAELMIFNKSDNVITTHPFKYTSTKGIMDSKTVESTNEFPALMKVLEVGDRFKDVDPSVFDDVKDLATKAELEPLVTKTELKPIEEELKKNTTQLAETILKMNMLENKIIALETGGGVVIPPLDTTPPILMITPNGGIFATYQSVTMSTNETADIYYTIDGSDPKTSGTKVKYIGPITLTNTITVKAYAFDVSGNTSDTQVITYTKQVSISPVTGVTLNKISGSIEKNQTTQLTASVIPSNADNKNVSWASSNESIATVSNTGIVTALGVGNATITATTADGGFKATFNLTVIEAIVGFNYNNIDGTVGENHITFDQTSNGQPDFVHPSVLYFENGWNGHKYWMGVNAYPLTNSFYENPYLFYSDDGDNWHTPSDAANPLYGIQSGTSYNSDAHIFMDEDGVTMHYLNRAYKNPGSIIMCTSTTDGKTWTPIVNLFQSPAYPDYVSPSVCKVNGKYYMFGIDVNDLNHICVLEATNVYGQWTEINRISNGVLGQLWHAEVQYVNQEFIVVASSGSTNGGVLMLGKFYSVMDSVIEGRSNAFLVAPGKQTWDKQVYKSSFVMKSQTDYDVFLGVKGSGLSGTPWRVIRVKANPLDSTLDLMALGYQEVASYTDNSTFTNAPGKSKKMDHHRYAVEATLTTTGNYPIAFADTTNELASFYLDNTTPPILKAEAWNIVGGTKQKDIPYGLKPNDRVSFVKDKDIEFYINGRLVYKIINAEDKFDNIGTLFGDKIGGLLTNIKVYKKEKYIYSDTKADAYKAETLNEYSINPDNFILVDEFNRANGVPGTSDNGVTYEVIGSPTITGNTLKPNSSANAVLVPATGNYSIQLKLSTVNMDNGYGVYLKYTDDNNNIKFGTKDKLGLLRMEVKEAGVLTTTTVPLPTTHENYRNWRLDVINGFLYAYCDSVYMNKIAIPSKAFVEKVGFTAILAGTQFDYIIIKKLP